MKPKDYKYRVGDLVKNTSTNVVYEILRVETAANTLTSVSFYYLKNINERGFWIREGLLYSKYEPVDIVMKILFDSDQGSAATRGPRQAISGSSIKRGLGGDNSEE